MTKRLPRTTLTAQFSSRFEALSNKSNRLSWPSLAYENDFEKFCNEILGLRLWKKQREFAAMMTRSRRIACKAGQKLGKSLLMAARALHFYCTYAEARVFLMSPTDAQVKDPLWLEITKLVNRSGTCLACRDKGSTEHCVHSCPIDGTLNTHRTGLVKGTRVIRGFATRFANNVSGKSGKILWILDECPGIDDDVFEAVIGTMMGGASMIISGNPTCSSGEFFNAFHKQSALYDLITLSCFDSPNVTGEFEVFGCATIEEIKEKELRWGGKEDSRYVTRVLGEFAAKGRAQMLSPAEIEKAQIRGEILGNQEGPLFIGVDVAGEGTDLWTFAVRRGNQILELLEYQHQTVEQGVLDLADIILNHLQPGEVARIRYDGSGFYGNQFGIALADHRKRFPDQMSVQAIFPSAADPSGRFDRLRDALLENLVSRIQKDLGIPAFKELEEELLILERDFDRQDRSGKTKVKDKRKIRKELGRSPDRCDALSYCLWNDDDGKKPSPAELAIRKNQGERMRSPINRIKSYDPRSNNPQYRK